MTGIATKLAELKETELEMFLMDDLELCDEFEEVGNEKIIGSGRWTTHYEKILKHKEGTFWKFDWSRGSTEYQDQGPEDITFIQVYPHQIISTVYRTYPVDEKIK